MVSNVKSQGRVHLLWAVTLAVAAALSNPAANSAMKSGIDVQFFDHAVRPQEDFYQYVNGGWLSTHSIPPDAVRISAASIVNDATQLQLKAIVEAATQSGPQYSDPDERRIALLYGSFMDEPRAERAGLAPVRARLMDIHAIKSRSELVRRMGELGCIGVTVPIGESVLNDRKNPDAYALSLYQWGLGMPGPNYYLGAEAALKDIRAEYLLHVSRTLGLIGDNFAARDARHVLDLEMKLAAIQVTAANGGDPNPEHHLFSLPNLLSFAPGMDWRAFLIGNETYGHATIFHVGEPAYFKALAQLVRTAPLSSWKAYLSFQLLRSYSPFLGRKFSDEAFAFEGRTLRGVQEQPPRWSRGLDLVNDSMGEGLGRLYVARYISPVAKIRVTAMVQTFIEAFKRDIDTLTWMGPDTKRRAKDKLLTLHAKVGYPEHWRDYSGLEIVAGDLVGNVMRARHWEYQRNVRKLGRPVDREEWYITPQTADAYQWLPQNEIVIGAALLQPPFFDPEADDAVNYGAIGGTIGHEISHGFDNIGSQYDGKGVLLGKPGWFTVKDQEMFDSLGRALVAQYSALQPLPGYPIDGERTLSENMADTVGAAIAYRAYHLSLGGLPAPIIDGMTGDQRFFIGWAQRRRGNYRDKELIRILKSDEHSPPAIRAEVPLMNLDAFVAAFDVKEGDAMYLPPQKRIRIW
jgi:putative endopeptidase